MFLAHLGGEVAQIAKAVERLPYGTTGQHVHIPKAAVAVLISALDQAGIIVGQRVAAGLDAVELFLANSQRVVKEFEGLVVAGNKLLAGRNLTPHQGKAAEGLRAAFGILAELAVEQFDVFLQLGALALQTPRR